MKYGETTFDILYLLFAISSGIIVLLKRKDSIGRLMGFSALILGCGDAFHLIPRVLNYFVDKDFTAWLGFGLYRCPWAELLDEAHATAHTRSFVCAEGNDAFARKVV